MNIQPRLTLLHLFSACALVLLSTETVKAAYNFDLPALKNGCVSSSTHPDCFDDQNVKRASGFSHFDGSGSPTLIPPDDVPALFQAKPLWSRLKDTSYSMHVIDQSKPKTLLEIINGREIYTDEDHNHWTIFNGNWYVKMTHQFDIFVDEEKDLWCKALPACTGSGGYAAVNNVGVGGATIFFAPILSKNAPQEQRNRVNLGDWLRARPEEYDLSQPETVNARANFFVGGRGIGSYDPPNEKKAFWNHLALVWVDPTQLFRPAQNPNISIKDFAAVADHLAPIAGAPAINWCIDQFSNVVNSSKNQDCDMANNSSKKGNRFDQFQDYHLSYFNAGSNSDDTENFFPFPFTGLGVTYDPYYQAQLEAAKTEAELALILPKLIGTSEYIYAIPEKGQSDPALMFLDEAYPIINTVPGALPILGVGAGFAFTRRLRRRIRQGGRVLPQR